MKRYMVVCLASVLALLMTACGERSLVKKDLAAKAAAIGDGLDMEQVLSGCADRQEREAMEFLYAYMPVGDVADYSPQLYLDGVRTVFRAREEMPWGREVPEELFRHFVLPLRVNNETLDEFRTECYEDLSGRVRNLSMHDAVLEVNHWCHERVTYTPSDARTSSPLASIRTGYGRCGEESVLLCPSGLYPAMGTYRRQPCVGRGLGGRALALPRSLRAGARAGRGLVQFHSPARCDDAHQCIRPL